MNNREACNPFLLINFYKTGLAWAVFLHPTSCSIQSLSGEVPTLCAMTIIQVLASLVCWGCDVCVHLMLTASASLDCTRNSQSWAVTHLKD